MHKNMAASIDPRLACRKQHIEELLDLLSTQFLEMVPIRKMKWKVLTLFSAHVWLPLFT